MSYKTGVWLAFGFLSAAWMLYLAWIRMFFMLNSGTAHTLMPFIEGTIVAAILLTIPALAFAARARREARTATAPDARYNSLLKAANAWQADAVAIVLGVLNIVCGLLLLLFSIWVGMAI